MITRPFGSKVWEFETSDTFLYYRFLRVLRIMGITPVEEYGETYYDFHGCKFCATRKERIRIEYVFRRVISLEPKYLFDLDSYQNRAVLYREEKYAIY